MSWFRRVVDALIEIYLDCEYEIVLTLKPSPSEYKGLDGAKIDVWQTHNRKFPQDKRMGKHLGSWHRDISECIKEVDNYINFLQGLNKKPEIIERDGKKFMLVEIDKDGEHRK
jgi:phage-related tail protein